MTGNGTMRTGIAALLTMLAAPAFAASQGDVGLRSAGSVLITASVAAQARLTDTAGDPCVTVNTATRAFDVTADPAAAAAMLTRCGDDAPRTGLAHARADGISSVIVSPE